MGKKAFIAAGGTGGHINAALTLGSDFEKLGYNVQYISGQRHLDYKLYRDVMCMHLPAQPLVGKSPTLIIKSMIFNSYVFLIMLLRFLIERPKFALGCGGYVCGPTLLAAKILFIPVFILEQNSVMGLTNKILGKISNQIFTCFEKTLGLSADLENKVKNLGNPIRSSFFPDKFELPQNENFNILVFGGSLGSLEINNMIKSFVERDSHSIKLNIFHQTGKNEVDISPINDFIEYKQLEYIDDMFAAYMNADLVICRAGASTITELRIVKRPCVLIPITFHADKHQVHNANALKEEAEFPVFTSSGEELSANNCEKLSKLIDQEYNRDKSNDHLWYKEKPVNSSDLIVNEIESYV